MGHQACSRVTKVATYISYVMLLSALMRGPFDLLLLPG